VSARTLLKNIFAGLICKVIKFLCRVPLRIQDDTEEARKKWDLVHPVSLLKPEAKRKRRRHTLTYGRPCTTSCQFMNIADMAEVLVKKIILTLEITCNIVANQL
jgi:hypothetical protein